MADPQMRRDFNDRFVRGASREDAAMGAFSQSTLRGLSEAVESGEDYSDAVVRVAAVHTRKDVALTVYMLGVANKRHLQVIAALRTCAVLLGLLLIVTIFK
jgi:hypothetical protein